MIDLDVPLPKSPRPLPRRIPPGAHVLSHDDLRAVARHFAGRDNARLGEELMAIVFPKLFDATTGRVIPQELLHELGEGNHHAGKRVLEKFLANIRRQPAVDLSRISPVELRRLRIGGIGNITALSINLDSDD
jgi:hypothetical protein